MGNKAVGLSLGLMLVIGVASPHQGMANNDACWGDNSRQDITCVKITEPLLLTLRGRSMADVRRLLNASGRLMPGKKRPGFGDTLRFLSNYGRGSGTGSGSINVIFSDDRAVVVFAEVDTEGLEGSKDFVWNAYAPPKSVVDEFNLSTRSYTRPPFCSDLSGLKPCKNQAGASEQEKFDHELMLMKEQFGSNTSSIDEIIKEVCNLGGSSATRPYQCDAVSNQSSTHHRTAAGDIIGTVLPFKIVRAIRNYGYKDGTVLAGISVSVQGGSPNDWMATGVYVAENAIINDVNAAEVLVIVPNPWADFPPQLPKELAKVYYDPGKRIWNKRWGIFVANHAATLADIDEYLLEGKLLDQNISDPEKQEEEADKAARIAVIKKYGLPNNWKSAADTLGYLGIQGEDHNRSDIHIKVRGDISTSLADLRKCLTKNVNGTPLWQGCMPKHP